ncbi:hypothetical protein [Cellulomonas sp. C5510]|uniref:hypothetical protein n=1 Tax=Cellulomonas sp. C5510 TaxID=2871170 RepID=UPI001C97A3F2|nr:hypothetical protein [Cellulomonas sp. C5510]QZN85089.1 hypothetical protein K5O09_15020 [Cellulomonas sp. C5510]
MGRRHRAGDHHHDRHDVRQGRGRAGSADPTVALPAGGRARGRSGDGRRAASGSRAGLLLRAAALGVAAGSRASLAVAAPALADPGSRGVTRLVARAGVAAELVGDKLPSTPSRLLPPGPQSRAVAAALGGAALARQRGRSVWLPAATAALWSTAGTWGGAAWRGWAAQRGPDWRGAVAEDAVAVTLARLAARR